MLANDDLIVARKYEISSRADLIDRSGRGDLPLKAPQIQQNGPVTEYIWNQHNVPAVAAEDAVPSRYEDFPWVQLSEFETWKDVAAWLPHLGHACSSPAIHGQNAKMSLIIVHSALV